MQNIFVCSLVLPTTKGTSICLEKQSRELRPLTKEIYKEESKINQLIIVKSYQLIGRRQLKLYQLNGECSQMSIKLWLGLVIVCFTLFFIYLLGLNSLVRQLFAFSWLSLDLWFLLQRVTCYVIENQEIRKQKSFLVEIKY